MKQITANIQGGLGNQCFIYSTARALALRSRAALKINCDLLAEDFVYKRKFALGAFQIAGELERLSIKPIRVLKRLRYKLLKTRTGRFGNVCLDRLPYQFRSLPTEWNGKLTLDGYWQSERYFADAARQLVEDFQLKDNRWLASDVVACQIAATENSIFLHARSYTDIPGKQDYSNALPISYYVNALSYLRQEVRGGTVFLFSDDIKWANDRLSGVVRAAGYDCVPVGVGTKPDGVTDQLRDFTLMRLCKHGILADSSFSWWAGWLGEHEHTDAIRIRVNRVVMNRDYWPERWVAIDA